MSKIEIMLTLFLIFDVLVFIVIGTFIIIKNRHAKKNYSGCGKTSHNSDTRRL